MPTAAELVAALDATGLPVCTGRWPEGHAAQLPYITLVPGESRNQKADGRNHYRCRIWDAELYMRRLDMSLVVRAEDALDALGVAYDSVILDAERTSAPVTFARFSNIIVRE